MRINRDRLAAYLLMTPSIVAVAIFIYGFIGWTLRVSLTNWKGLTPNYDWAGLVNYVNLFSDRRFLIAVNNTVLFTLLFMIGSLVLGLLLALMLDAGLPGEGFFRSVYLLPMSISFIVTGVVWRWLMNPAQGDRLSGINLIFQALGLNGLISTWYTTPTYGIAAIALPAMWQMSGYVMALYLAGLRSIPEEVREAARVDGANGWQIFRYIVFPLLQPVTLSAVVILAHISLKVFDLILAVAGKQIQLDVPAIYMWNITFDGNFYARGASIAILILVAVSIFVIPYLINSIRTEAKV
jgi:glucose/mannose transport system permease protein